MRGVPGAGALLAKCPLKSSKKISSYQVVAKHGGFRKGAGRPKGSRNRATIAREARQRQALAAARAANANLSAIDYLLQYLRDPTNMAPREGGDVRRALSRIPSEG
jgi:hypothetical protein